MASHDTKPSAKKRKRDMADPHLPKKARKKQSKKQKQLANGAINKVDVLVPPEENGANHPLTTSLPEPMALVTSNGVEPAGSMVVSGEGKDADTQASGWVVSRPSGGRMANIDPILTKDDKYLIVAYSTSVQVYSTSDSLLVRCIQIPQHSDETRAPVKAVAAKLSTQSKSLVWVACSDGRIWGIDWAIGAVRSKPVNTDSDTIMDMVVMTVPLGGVDTELLIVAQPAKPSKGEASSQDAIVAYTARDLGRKYKLLMPLPQSSHHLRNLAVIPEHHILLASSNKTLVVGTLRTDAEKVKTLGSSWYQFENAEIITSLDARVVNTTSSQDRSSGAGKKEDPLVDIIVGGAQGSIYCYDDVVTKLSRLSNGGQNGEMPACRKAFWHHRAVHALKWSRDGNYMISGGSERTLVLWQNATYKKSFLPHLSGGIENIVVSELGSSYVLHLDDNSVMVLSTITMEPTAYVSGIQSATWNEEPSKDNWVSRVGGVDNTRRAVPAALHPENPSRLYLCVGSGNQATTAGDSRSTPFLQSVDLESFRSVSRQAIARNQPSDVRLDPQGHAISEPRLTHIAFSHDGKWLATVDDWTPSLKDNLNISPEQQRTFSRERREIYLKFWELGGGDEPLSLVSRINSPHVTSSPEQLFGLASDPTSARFATIGNDGIARLWRPKARQQDGILATTADGRALHTWTCTQMIALSDESGLANLSGTNSAPNQGSIAFSEDGSTLFVAFGSPNDGSVYVIDVNSGEVKFVLDGLWTGHLVGIQALSPYIIVLSKTLKVYDVVADELCYGIQLSRTPQTGSQWDTTHVEVDRKTRHFAVVLPSPPALSELVVFSPEISTPLMSKRIPGRVLSLISSPDTSGFITLDDQAQLRTITEAADTEALAVAQPLEEMRLDSTGKAEGGPGAMILAGEAEDGSGDEEEEIGDSMEVDSVDSDDEGADPTVVNRQKLADIFDAAPAFAMPAIEDVFYKVAGLLATKKVVPPAA